mgnify:CR=1 FL=1
MNINDSTNRTGYRLIHLACEKADLSVLTLPIDLDEGESGVRPRGLFSIGVNRWGRMAIFENNAIDFKHNRYYLWDIVMLMEKE